MDYFTRLNWIVGLVIAVAVLAAWAMSPGCPCVPPDSSGYVNYLGY